MIPTDPYHQRLADERAAMVADIETRIEGCSDHTHGPYPREEVNA